MHSTAFVIRASTLVISTAGHWCLVIGHLGCGGSRVVSFATFVVNLFRFLFSSGQFTTFCGLPVRKVRTFSTAVSISRARAARVAHAMCGVMKQFFAL